MKRLYGKDINDGLSACMQTMAASKLAMDAGLKLTDLQRIEAINQLDLIKRQADYMLPDFSNDENKQPKDNYSLLLLNAYRIKRK